jgi:hypothetical protein
MKIFISWSGERSRAVAKALHDWLPNVIQAIQPWMSANDTDKGTRWRAGLANELEQASTSIICLTPDNLEAPWINFEAGALSKQQQSTYVCTFLFGLEPADVREPLAQFQATKAEKEDTRLLIHTINRSQGNEALSEVKVNEAFEVWWPKLEQNLNDIQESNVNLVKHTKGGQDKQEGVEYQRDIREILGEILILVREQARAEQRRRGARSDISIRLASTMSWPTEDAQLLFNYYRGVNDAATREKLSRDEEYARWALGLLKAEESEISSAKQSLEFAKGVFSMARKKEQSDDNSDS